MKKEIIILDIVSTLIVVGAIVLELFNSIKETGELSIRSLLMNTSAPVTNTIYTADRNIEDSSIDFAWRP